jgi:glycosyltransferase involved in cell wall biosynthesis
MTPSKLRIVHCFRSPVGGIFRHVRDLIEAQLAEGHEVGILCDSITGGAFEEKLIAEIAPKLSLGVHRVTMRRSIAPSDIADLWRTYALIRDIKPDVLHGHGAKGGAYARLVGSAMRLSGKRTARLYTPHGGSMHYDPKTLWGRVFFLLEGLLEKFTDHLLFVSEYEQKAYQQKVGMPKVASRVVHNGLSHGEFEPVAPVPDAADFLYLGMLRSLKGPDIFINALAELTRAGDRPATAVVVGAGEQKPELMKLVEEQVPGLVRFVEPMPAREALKLAQVMVLPSRADSLPYVVLEALAADRPVIAVDVGGVSEIIPPSVQPLVKPMDSRALAEAMAARLNAPQEIPKALRQHVRTRFSIDKMAGDTMAAYRRALAGQTVPTLHAEAPRSTIEAIDPPAEMPQTFAKKS